MPAADTDAAGHTWGPRPEDLRIDTALCVGEFEPGEREHRHLSDDQAICIGYANTMADTNHLPPAHWLANRIGRELFRLRLEKGAGQVGPDGKVLAQVRTDGHRWQPERVSISLHHHEGSDWLLLRRIAEEAVARACAGKRLPELTLNGAGMFVAGGPNGDNGTTGKKLVMDAYGPTVPIGGGAWSGKDFNKVDRAGGMLARELALEAVKGAMREARVELRYEPGGAGPAAIEVQIDGAPVPSETSTIDVTRTSPVARIWHERFAGSSESLSQRARWGHLAASPEVVRVQLVDADAANRNAQRATEWLRISRDKVSWYPRQPQWPRRPLRSERISGS